MKLSCTINGQPAEIEISDIPIRRGALTKTGAAEYLSVSVKTIYRLAAMGEIQKTFYGTYPITGLDAHLERERQRGKKQSK